jgi:cytoskeletal protein RodZ
MLSSIDMSQFQHVGEFLKSYREEAGISLADISKQTKITLKILVAIESGDKTKLPDATYVKGFIKSYAKILKIPTENLNLELERSYPTEKIEHINTSLQQIEQEDESISSVKEKLVHFSHFLVSKNFLASAAILIVSFYIVKGIVGFLSEVNSNKVVEKKQKPVKAAVVEVPATIEIEEVIEESVEVEVEPEPAKAEVVKEVIKEVIKEVPKQGNFPYIEFNPIPTNLYTLDKKAEMLKDANILPAHIKNAYKKDGIPHLYIKSVSGDNWLSYKADDDAVKRFVLKEGRSVLIRGNLIRVFLGNLNAATMVYNNQLVITESKSGVKSLVFPQERANEFELPLFPMGSDGVSYTAEEYKALMSPKH